MFKLEHFPKRMNRADSPAGTNRIQESYWKAGQYEMGKPYSEDLRERVIGAAQDGATIPKLRSNSE